MGSVRVSVLDLYIADYLFYFILFIHSIIISYRITTVSSSTNGADDTLIIPVLFLFLCWSYMIIIVLCVFFFFFFKCSDISG
jgi:uncharacterized membrane protein